MSSTEKPGFFQKLFGLSVSRSTSDSGPPPSSNGGSLSSHDEYSNTNGSSPTASKPLRYLSPTAIESSFSRVSSRTVEGSSDTARKRPLESPQATSGIVNGSFYISDTAKRFRGSVANTSLISEPVTRLELPRLDTTWSAGMGVVSPTNLSHSPCSSVRSLRSRITRPSSRTSVLSSKTAALLGQIEKVSTPAQDARRMPMLRVGLNKERWNSLGPSTTNIPSLNRISSVPSRYQVMSSFLTPIQKKPYWRDVARERCEEMNEKSPMQSESCSSVSIKRSENGEKNGAKDHLRMPAHQPVLKGADGSNVNREKNKYSANDITQDISADLEALNSVEGLNASQFAFSLPKSGFLSKEVKPSFSFNKPVKITEIIEESESSGGSESDERESSGSESGSGRYYVSDSGGDERHANTKATEKTSDTSSSADNTSKETSKEEAKKISPTKTAANFVPKGGEVLECGKEETVAVSQSESTVSSSSAVNWDCSACFVGNKATDLKCACCGETKPGSTAPAASSSNVFGDRAFKATLIPTSSSSVATNWDCPSCCVDNKATDVKCVCCGENKPGAAAPPSSSSNVFGDNAFKPTSSATPGKFSFGFGSDSSSTPSFDSKPSTENGASKSTTGAIKFGITTSTESAFSSTSLSTTTRPTAAVSIVPNSMFGASSAPLSVGSTGESGPFTFGIKASSDNGQAVKAALTVSTPLFSSTLAPLPVVASTTAAPLFGLLPASSTISSPSTVITSISSIPLFGSSSRSTIPSSGFCVSSSGSTLPIFGSSSLSTATSSSSIPLFGSSTLSTAASSVPLFGGPITTTTTASAAPLSNGSSLGRLAFNFGQSGTSSELPKELPLFGSFSEQKPVFVGTKGSDDEGPGTKKAMFGGSTPTPTIPAFSFGGINANTAPTSLSGSSCVPASNPFGGIIQSAPASSFSIPTAPPSSFIFGSQGVTTSFNFGGPSVAAPSSSPFVFGSSSHQTPSAPPPPPSFGIGSFGAAPPATAPFAAPPDASNPFAFNSSASSGSRKMIQAKRRLPGKR